MKTAKKLSALILALIMLISLAVIPTQAGYTLSRNINKSSFKTDYPFVFVHGMGGWGPSGSFNSKSPYWGGGFGKGDTDLIRILNEQGIKAYAAEVGPFNSAWDRACELYAQLTGTLTDYGEAHSKAHGHDRYGFSYVDKPTMGKPWNPNQKINLVGHSFGGATIRLFTSLMTYGNAEEKKATGDNTSPLFKGGHKSVHSCITISSPHNGTPLCNLVYDSKVPFFFLAFGYNLAGAISGNDFSVFSMQMSHFGLTPAQNRRLALFNPVKIFNYCIADDNCYSDMTIAGAKALNQTIRLSPDTYYYSYTCTLTDAKGGGGKLQFSSSARPVFGFTATLLAMSAGKTFDGTKMDGNWIYHDGVVPLASALYPLSDAATATDYENAVAKGNKIQKGRWYYMDTLVGMDHFDICGTEDYPTTFDDFYFGMVETVNSR